MAIKIYTKTGDKGETALFGGKRLPKHHLRIEAYGTVDELNAYMGLLRDYCPLSEIKDFIKIQQDLLFVIGAHLAADPEKGSSLKGVEAQDVLLLEKAIDKMNESLPPLKNFIIPGGHPTVSTCHIARCVCRRAERRVVALKYEETVDEIIIRFLNRLSDYLFVLGRLLSKNLNVEEVAWLPRS